MIKELYLEIEDYINGRTNIIAPKNRSAHVIYRTVMNVPENKDSIQEPYMLGKYQNVVLLSGGMDSFVMHRMNTGKPHTLFLNVDVGTRYITKERKAIERMLNDSDVVEYRKYDLSGRKKWEHILPARNLLLIGLALEYLQPKGEIWLGAVKGEIGYDKGDKSHQFFKAVEEYAKVTAGIDLEIRTLRNKTKNDWLKWYLEYTGGDRDILRNSVTCFTDTKTMDTDHCGQCKACLRKAIAMKYCHISDQEMKQYFQVSPFWAMKFLAQEYIQKFEDALEREYFAEYDRERCIQDLRVLKENI